MRDYILCLALSLAAGANPATAIGQKGTAMAKHASGTFDVKIGPQPAEAHVGDPTIARMAIDKQYHGDLEARGLAHGTSVGVFRGSHHVKGVGSRHRRNSRRLG